MQTNLANFIKDTPEGLEADSILRTCVHCGFCLATCPTYQLLGDELDSPRGRIYLIKQMLEGAPVTAKTQLHLDRCLTCRACESTCPSGVKYGHLVDIGRAIVEKKIGRKPMQALQRFGIRRVLPQSTIFGSLLKLGQTLRPLLPGQIQGAVPPVKQQTAWPASQHARTMLVLDGCVQPSLEPNINGATARLLDKLGINLVRAEKAGCCGAVSYHLNAQDEGLDYMRRNIDAWLPYLDQGAEAIVMTASGCGVTVKEYGYLLRNDPMYAEKAERISAATKDISEIILVEKDCLADLLNAKNTGRKTPKEKIAFHSPCTLQHGQKITGVIEALLTAAGFELTPTPEKHLCCGSAGTYSILQKELSQQLLKNKVNALESGEPKIIATANIGCLMHLQSGTQTPVKHWVEIVDELLA
ncbi:glycolate oxidase subunit GlcF [Sulfurirhabdus autotrophica]|uniref:Glycolate oxidase iron-sulfur subunit n=1 Tax=Sulfurirhabdus autotrophica TaxID=1706046 RepID=A0A4R3XZ03_9PROT|nr:glycolate oxidase subunit GlcF [Sulfurirhabdus autotrophica]TCV82923.1 glycolate oxidase iron-sulfur subunit [Sulfurirhabdus autotrophica]